MYIVYILESIKKSGYYIGQAEDIQKRLKQHNTGRVTSTKSGTPWRLIYVEKLETRQEAYRRELQIKSYKGGRAFKELINK